MDPTDRRDPAGLELPFVGRRDELDLLQPRDPGVPHRWVVAASGVGKTRLLREYQHGRAAGGERPVWIAGSARDAASRLAAALGDPGATVLVDDADRLSSVGRAALDAALDRSSPPIVASSTGPAPTSARVAVVRLDPLDETAFAELLPMTPWSALFGRADRQSDDSAAVSLLREPLRFGYVGPRGSDDARRAREILDGLGDRATPAVRARLRARIALGLLGEADSRAIAEESLATALDVGDPRTLAEALIAYSVTDLGPDSLDERLAMARRVLGVAAELDDPHLAGVGRFLLLGALLEAGDIGAVDAHLAQRVRHSSAPEGSGRHDAWFRAMRALLEGRVGEAEGRCADALEVARAEGDPDAESVYFGQLGVLRWLQDREAEVEPFYLAAREEQPDAPVWSAVLARLWALAGRANAAQAVLDEFRDLSAIPRDRNWLLSMCVLAEAAVLVGDRTATEALRSELLPYAARLVPIGAGIACFGSVARPLALTARALGRTDEAERHLRTAVRVCSAAGARPWLAQAHLDLAELLAADGRPDESLVREAAATVRATGAAVLAPRLPADPPVAPPSPTAEPGSGRPAVRVLGAFEVVGADGRRATWTSRKARELLKILVARHGRPVPREELIGMLWPDDRPEEAANRLSVALSTVRRALDPGRRHPPGHFLHGQGDSVAVVAENVDVDLIEFLARARAWSAAPAADRRDAGLHVLQAHRGPAFADEPDAPWAAGPHLEASALFLTVARAVGEDALTDDPLVAAEVFGRILAEDPYDEGGHLGLVAAYDALGAHGRSEEARRNYYAHMAEIGIPVQRLRGDAGRA